MGTPIGNLGGIAVVPEATYGTTPGAPSWEWQHPAPSTLGFRREMVEPNLLSYSAHTARGYSGGYVDGDLVVGLDVRKSIIGNILGLGGEYDTDHYRLAGGTIPDVNSLSCLMNYGGGGTVPANNHEWVHRGVKANALRFDLLPDSNSTLTMVGIGKGTTKSTTALDPTPPAETNVFMPSDFGGVTVNGQALCLLSGTVEALTPKTGFERRCLGGDMKEPITNGRPDVTFNLNCSLDDGTDSDTIAILAEFLAGNNIGDIIISDTSGVFIHVENGLMSGDWPGLSEGEIEFTITGHGEYIDVFTA